MKMQVHHDSAPCRGQTNSFDLVRIHKFGNLDSEADKTLPVTQRPSYRAMCEFAMALPAVRAQMAAEYDVTPIEDDVVAAAGVTISDQSVMPLGNDEPVAATRFRVIPAAEFATSKPLDWIIKGMIPHAELMVVYGESGSGKSFLALDLAAAIVRGVDWQELKVKKGRVVYICAEGVGGFRQRVRAYGKKHAIDLTEMPGVIADAPNLASVDDVNLLLKSLRTYGAADLVIVDTLSATMPGLNENSGEDVGKVLEHCKAIHKTTGALVMLIHHSGKDKARGSRGWSGIKAAADAEIEVTRVGAIRAATLTKLKDGADGRVWGFGLEPIVLGADADGEEVTSCVVMPAEPPAALAPSAYARLGKYAAIALDVLKLHAVACAIPLAMALREGVQKLPKDTEAKFDRRRQSIQRGIEELIVKKLAFMHPDDMIGLSEAQSAEEDADAEQP